MDLEHNVNTNESDSVDVADTTVEVIIDINISSNYSFCPNNFS